VCVRKTNSEELKWIKLVEGAFGFRGIEFYYQRISESLDQFINVLFFFCTSWSRQYSLFWLQ
jgi:hypothetical protein